MVRPSTKPSHRDNDSSSVDSYATFSTSSGVDDSSTTSTPKQVQVARRGSRTSTIRRGSASTRISSASATPPPPVVVRSPQTAKRGRSIGGRGRVPTPHPVQLPTRTAPPSPPKVPSSTQTRRKESSNRDRGNNQDRAAKQPANTTRKGKKTGKKYRPAAGVLAQIRFFQVDTNNLIPKLPFQRLVREISQHFGDGVRYTGQALEALQAAAEAYIVGILEDSDLIAKHSKRVTLMDRDMKLAYRIRGDK